MIKKLELEISFFVGGSNDASEGSNPPIGSLNLLGMIISYYIVLYRVFCGVGYFVLLGFVGYSLGTLRICSLAGEMF